NTEAEQWPRPAVLPLLASSRRDRCRIARQCRGDALPQHGWMRLEQLAAKRRADQRVAHRASPCFGVALEASHEERTLVGRQLVVDESGDLIVDLVCHVR